MTEKRSQILRERGFRYPKYESEGNRDKSSVESLLLEKRDFINYCQGEGLDCEAHEELDETKSHTLYNGRLYDV